MGFAGEIKDFLGAAKDTIKLMSDTSYKGALTKNTEMQTAKTEKDMNDPLVDEERKAKIANILQRTAQSRSSTSLQDLARRQMLAAATAPNPVVQTMGDEQPSAVVRPVNTTPAIQPLVQEYARGGLVKKFQAGGYADDDDEDDVAPSYPGGYPPAIGGAPSATDFSAQARPQGAIPTAGAQTSNDPVSEGLKYGVVAAGLNGAMPPMAKRNAYKAYAMGAGGAPINDMLQVYRKVDPSGKMPEGERNLRALNAVYNFKLNSGDMQGAQRAASQMLQHYKTASMQYAAISRAALENGNIDAGLKAAMKSYANIPDGNDMKLWQDDKGRVNFSVTDANGKKVDGGLSSPQEIGSAITKIGSPGGFEQLLVSRAGEKLAGRQPKPTAEGGTDPSKPKDYEDIQRQIGAHVDDYVKKAKDADPAASGEGGGIAKSLPTDKEIGQLKNIMYHIRRNNDVTDDEAMRMTQAYIGAPHELKEGQKPAFKVIKDDDAKMRTIRFGDGREIEMPTSDYAALANARGQRLKEIEDEAKKPKVEGYGPKFTRAGQAAIGLGGEAVDAMSAAGQGVGGAIGRGAGAVGSGIGAAGSAINQGLGGVPANAAAALAAEYQKRFGNPDNVPPTEPPI